MAPQRASPFLPPTLDPRNLARTLEARVPAKALRDVLNRLRYGRGAPQSDELLWIDPAAVRFHYDPDPASGAPRFRRSDSGKVVDGDWDLSRHAIGQGIKYRAVLARYRDGLPWHETGLYDEMLARIARDGVADGCRSLADIERRYARLDDAVEEIRRSGGMAPRATLPGKAFRREHGGVLVHVGRDGALLRAGGGQHRFAIAVALELPRMPAQLGVVHRQAVVDKLLAALRQPS